RLQAAGAPGGVIAGQRVGPVQKRAQAADGDADALGGLADGLELLRAGLGRQVVVQVVVQLDAVEAGVFGQLQALLEIHALRVGEGQGVGGLLRGVLRGGAGGRVGRGGGGGGGEQGGPAGGEGGLQGRAARDERRGGLVGGHGSLLAKGRVLGRRILSRDGP